MNDNQPHDIRHAMQDASTILSQVREAPEKWALFLDIDGTLLDIAATPDAVIVPPGLTMDLQEASTKLGGALACVTGRAIDYVDMLFDVAHMPVAGLHGAERRRSDFTLDRAEITPELIEIKATLAELAQGWPGVIIEDKGAAVGVHFRLAPQFQDVIELTMLQLLHKAGQGFTLQPGKMVIEMRPAHADKGGALRDFMAEEPFMGRLPIAIGDDITDEAMFAAAHEFGGFAIRTGDGSFPGVARYSLTSPAHLRAWLAEFAASSMAR